MAGKRDMTLHGLRQLAEWSIQHSCMEPDLMREVRADWERMWLQFCERIVRGDFTFRDDVAGGNGGGNGDGGGDGGAAKP
jgi:adenosine deaminase CECR1